jgi:hypothetical protein
MPGYTALPKSIAENLLVSANDSYPEIKQSQ